MAMAPTIFSSKFRAGRGVFAGGSRFATRGYFMKGPQPRQPHPESSAIEPDRQLRHIL
jgi:hypothetical protein